MSCKYQALCMCVASHETIKLLSSLSFPVFLFPVLLFIAFTVTRLRFDPDLFKAEIVFSACFVQGENCFRHQVICFK